VQDEAVLLRRDRRTVGEDRGKLMRYLDGSLIDPNPVDYRGWRRNNCCHGSGQRVAQEVELIARVIGSENRPSLTTTTLESIFFSAAIAASIVCRVGGPGQALNRC